MRRVSGGFTLIELLITMIVMVILLVLGVAATGNIQTSGRDSERSDDIAAIARGLEQYYIRGNPYYTAGNTKGNYPGSNMMIAISGDGWCDAATFKNSDQASKYSFCDGKNYYTKALPGTVADNFIPPDKTTPSLYNPWLTNEPTPKQIITPDIQAALDNGSYVYKPMTSDSNGLCYEDTGCTRFVLLYKKESTGEIVTLESKHQ